MNLVVFAHPLEDSLCARVLERLVAGRDAVVVDLYRDGFSPVLTPADAKTYGIATSDALVARYQRQIATAQTVTFVFPVWMYGLPAILKGYFERVWVPEVTFSLKSGAPVALLMGLRKVRVACTFGQPRSFYERSADPVALFFGQLMSQNCAPDCVFDYAPLFGLDGAKEAAIASHLAKAERMFD